MLCIYLPLCGQEYSYVNYNTREGLAGSMVYCMVQDHDGFMWFGTETGLSRFDGTRFKNFTTAEGLPDNDIIRLFVDSRNRIWIVPFKNTISYYYKGKIHTVGNDSLLKKLQLKAEVISLVENDAGDIAIVEHKGITILKKDNSVLYFDKYKGVDIGSSSWVEGNEKKSFNFLMTLQANCYCAFELSGDSLVMTKDISREGLIFRHVYHSRDLEILRKADSIKIIMPDAGEEFIFKAPELFTTIQRFNDSLVAINSSKVQLYNFRQQRMESTLLIGKNISSVLTDSEGNTWFTTLGEGVYRLPSTDYRNYFTRQEGNALPVYSLLKTGDTLYAGTGDLKIWMINTRNGNINNLGLAKSSSAGRVVTLNRLPDGTLLAGSDMGLYSTNTNKAATRYYTSGSVKSTYVSGDSVISAESIGVFYFNIKEFPKWDTVWPVRSTAIYKKDKNLFIGTLNGLYILDGQKKSTYAGDLHAALKSKISAICEDNTGIIWVATNGNGIVGYKEGRVLYWLNKDSGLTSNICRSAFATPNALWIGTEKGLNRIEKKNDRYEIMRFTVSDGLMSNTINAIWADDTTVYAGTPDGITFFDAHKVNANSICSLNITSIHTNAQVWTYDTSGLELGKDERDIRIEFAGISFKSGGEITYRYRLKGLREDWQETQDNFLNYLSLPSGDYTLEMLAINKFGVESEMVRVQFTIAKLLWEKTWFRLAALLVIGLIMWKYFQFRIQRVKKQAEAQAASGRKITELEQMALKAQMNPHFIFNCLHSIQQFVIDKDTRGANKFISDFARLIRLTLDISSQTKISLSEEINYVSTYLELEKSKYEGKFDYAMEKSSGIDENAFYIPAMILQPYVENSIRHGVFHRTDNNGKIIIRFSLEGNYLLCEIEDNGVGRKASQVLKGEGMQVYQSKGMALTSKRIELLNGNNNLPILADIQDLGNNGEISGTKVTIYFPLEDVKKPV
jgi:ligand-binding sensor domain-containing protein